MSKPTSRGRSLAPSQVVSMLLVFLLLCGAGGVVAAGFAMPAVGTAAAITNASNEAFSDLPSEFNALEPSEVSVIKASNGKKIAQFYAENRIIVKLSSMSVNIQDAIVAVEDQRFYEHKGVDPTGIVRALVSNSNGSETQGASTLTQQYVRNVLIESAIRSNDSTAYTKATEKTAARKLREIKYALALEKKYSKKQILEGYLNIAAFSPSTYGVEASAQHYFSHSAKTLSIPEAALLAGLVNAPTAYDPVTHPDKAKSRMDWVLKKMYTEEFISKADYQAGLKTTISSMLHVTNSVGGCSSAGSAAYFCEYVKGEFENSTLYGKTKTAREQLLLRGGLQITTTLDQTKQAAADAAVQKYVPTGDPSNVKTALVSVQPGTGKIVAMSQNTNYGTATASDATATELSFTADYKHGGLESNGFQPGSVFKTFVLAEWYKEGKSAYTTLDTTGPHTFTYSDWTTCDPSVIDASWTVKNADASESGTHTVLQASAASINIGFARMLMQMNVCSVTNLAKSLGVTQANGQALVPRTSIILGSANSTPLAMANAYAAFAAHGKYCTPIAISAITDSSGKSLKVPSASCKQVLSTTVADQVALTLTQTLSSSGTASTAALAGRSAAGKTGTTDNMENAWFVGFTPQLAAAVWTGHSDGTYTMKQQTIGGKYYKTMYGSDLSAPEWKTYMDAALTGSPVESFTQVGLGSNGTGSSSTSVGSTNTTGGNN